MEGLAKILGASQSPCDLALLAALTSHQSDSTECRQAVGVGLAILLRTKGAKQPILLAQELSGMRRCVKNAPARQALQYIDIT